MAGLTACSSFRPAYVWNDLGEQKPRDTTHSSPIMQSWGASAEGANVKNPLIAPGFFLTVSSLSDPKLNGDFRVNYEGVLQLPYDVDVNTTGVTLSQLKKKIVELYRPFFKTSPDIDLRVKERSYWVDVRGLVQKPGRYLVDSTTSLDQVIALAGGAEKETIPQYARIQKGKNLYIVDLNQYYAEGESNSQILGWVGGESVFLQKEYSDSLGDPSSSSAYRLPIQVLGEVRNPGPYSLKPGSDFIDMLTQANGFTDEADLDRIEIIRRTKGRKRIFAFSWEQFERAPSPVQGDIILVHSVRQSKTEIKISMAALIVSIILTSAIIYDIGQND